MQKAALRKELLNREQNLSAVERRQATIRILDSLKKIIAELKIAAVISYIPALPGEIDLILTAAEFNGSLFFVTPFLQSFSSDLELVTIAESRLLILKEAVPAARSKLIKKTAGFSFVQLKDLNITATETLIIVPGAAFDKTGARLGRGGGFYDRFLSSPQLLGAIKIGICLENQLVPLVPIEDHDIPMDLLITEAGMITITPKN